MASNPFFELLNSILTKKQYWMNTPYDERQYNPALVTIAMSQHLDTVLHANELNQFYQVLSPKMHYDYLFHSVRPMKRPFRKWAKKQEEDELLVAIMEYYEINKVRAKEYLKLLGADQIQHILSALEKGTTK